MLADVSFVAAIRRRIEEERLAAESAVAATVEEFVRPFSEMDNPYLAVRATDVAEIGRRLLRTCARKGRARCTPSARPASSWRKIWRRRTLSPWITTTCWGWSCSKAAPPRTRRCWPRRWACPWWEACRSWSGTSVTGTSWWWTATTAKWWSSPQSWPSASTPSAAKSSSGFAENWPICAMRRP